MTVPTSSSVKALPADWGALRPGARLTIVKLNPDGMEAARYPGKVITTTNEGWLVARAHWTRAAVDLDGLTLEPGDELKEWFSPLHPFNSFAVVTPEGRLKGWYANVAHPARLEVNAASPVLFWHDLYVDLVGFPDGRFVIRDDDELRESGLEQTDLPLYRRIVAARAELIQRFTRRSSPFGNPLPARQDEAASHLPDLG